MRRLVLTFPRFKSTVGLNPKLDDNVIQIGMSTDQRHILCFFSPKSNIDLHPYEHTRPLPPVKIEAYYEQPIKASVWQSYAERFEKSKPMDKKQFRLDTNRLCQIFGAANRDVFKWNPRGKRVRENHPFRLHGNERIDRNSL
ncbi:hypothetical protein ACOME3_002588 [Neoechinorhynchus agilis]